MHATIVENFLTNIACEVGPGLAPFGVGAPVQWRGEGADYFYPTMVDI